MVRRFSIHLLVTLATLIAIANGCRKTETIEGYVVGSSMHPTLKGERYDVTCSDCGYRFEADAIKVPKNRRFVCPNCGFDDILIADLERLPAQEIKIQRIESEPKRWQLACFRDRATGKIVVKRVVGLPNESVGFVDGRISVDGNALQNPNQLLKIDVFDSRYRPKNTINRVRPIRKDESSWTVQPDGWKTYQSSSEVTQNPQSERLDWLKYYHRRCYANFQTNPWVPLPEDNVGFNQAVSRELNDVHFLDLEVGLELENCHAFLVQIGPAVLRATRSQDMAKPVFEVDVAISDEDLNSKSVAFDDIRWKSNTKLELSYRTVLRFSNSENSISFRFNDQPELELFQDSAGVSLTETAFQFTDRLPIFQLACLGGTMKTGDLLIKRDIYWSDIETSSAKPRSFKLRDDEYFVIGDNPAVSRDSRHYSPAGVRRSEIIGIID